MMQKRTQFCHSAFWIGYLT